MSFPDDDAPTEEELAAAKALAERVDSLLDGQALPPVVEADERELAELSSMIHAAHNPVALDAQRQASLIEAALAQGAGVGEGTSEGTSDLARARAKRAARWPIALGSVVAAAAVAILLLRTSPDSNQEAPAPVARIMELPPSQQSRPGDELVGQITRDASAHAGARLDQIYGDRMTGYRALQYRRLVGQQ